MSDSKILKFAKTKSVYRKQKNVIEAKKFSDITPTKQKLLREQYALRVKKKTEKKVPKKKPVKKQRNQRNYQYTVYLPEDYSDWEALDYWTKSKLVSSKSGVKLNLPENDSGQYSSIKSDEGNPIFDKGTYHVFTAKKLYTIKEWKVATKGLPTGFVSETGQNYGYTGGIVKKVKN